MTTASKIFLVALFSVFSPWQATTQSNDGQGSLKLIRCDELVNCTHTWRGGLLNKRIRSNGIVVAIDVEAVDHYIRVGVAARNETQQPIDILPWSISMQMVAPKHKQLKYQSPDRLIKRINGRAGWNNLLTALGAAGATQQSSTQTNTDGRVSVYGTGGSANGTYSQTSTSTTTVPDSQAQREAAAQIAASNATAANAARNINSHSLAPATLSPGQASAGYVYFEGPHKIGTTVTDIPINGIVFEFTFQWDYD